MARVLYAWEIGAGLGHLTNMLPSARGLLARCHAVHVTVRQTMYARQVLGKAGISFSQAPVWSGHPTSVNPASYAEILLNCGYASGTALGNAILEWRRCFSIHQPDLLIADHAPTALLAARGLRIRTAQIGAGFFSPPRMNPLPIFRNWENVDPQRVIDNESVVLHSINMALERVGAAPMSALSELFESLDQDLVCTWRDLDTYPDRTSAEYFGPIFAADFGQTAKWPKRTGPRVFLYIKPDYPSIHELLTALRENSLNGVAYIPGGIPKSLVNEWPSNVAVYAQPVRLFNAFQDADAVVCHAGPGTIAAALLAGKPLLLLPTQAEQLLNAQRAAALGAALAVVPELIPANMTLALRGFLNDHSFAAAAQQFALRHKDFDVGTQTSEMTTLLETLI